MPPEQEYLAAVFPEPVTLLHQQLRPFALGHHMLLQRLGSPFLSPSSSVVSPQLEDLYLAVFICAQTFEEANAALFLSQRAFQRQIRQWSKLVGPLADLTPLLTTFFDYLIAGTTSPRFQRLQRKGYRFTEPGAPLELLLLNTLTGHLHWSRSEALNCPYAWAQWLYCAWWESQGSIRIHSDKDQAFIEAARAAAAAAGQQLMRFTPEQIAALQSQRN